MSDDLINKGNAINAMCDACDTVTAACPHYPCKRFLAIESLPSAQPERLTDDDFETIRIHLSAFKEDLCNQRRWKEAEDYERLIGRFISFASAQQWMPCNERLPEEEKWYLITVHPEYVPEGCGQVDLLAWHKGNWWWMNGEGKMEKWPDPIIAWMSLPEPYKTERKKNDQRRSNKKTAKAESGVS